MTTITPDVEFLDVIVHVYEPAAGWMTRPAPRPEARDADPLD